MVCIVHLFKKTDGYISFDEVKKLGKAICQNKCRPHYVAYRTEEGKVDFFHSRRL